jgi:hypothetical protein
LDDKDVRLLLRAAIEQEENISAFSRLRDHNGQQLAYVYFENEPPAGDRPPSYSAEARRIAANIAMLPEQLRKL